ncbi:MAG: hypothetical protein CVU14_06840 [Bacteroidetes bacterium HGW-Bacteroidetes-9]|nr:MAG: hypothetical protein CVU14_06840 [Bacteroidetes bacterium HGW-Bacteroidetes-9]
MLTNQALNKHPQETLIMNHNSRLLTLSLILLSFFTLSSNSLAQNPIPNPGFEEWSGGEPIGWNTINQSVLGTSFICATRDQTNPQSGTSCLRLETVTHNIFLVGPVTMPGIVSLGEITLDILNQTGTVEGGVPIDTQPNMLHGWFRYQPSAGDSCIMGIGFTKWNGASRDTLAYSYTVIGGQNPNWQEFSVPIEYLIWEVPDTMNIMFFSSNILNGDPISGSKLWIDNLTLEYGPVSVSNIALKDEPTLRYRPDGTPVILMNSKDVKTEISIYSADGSFVNKQMPNHGQYEFSLETRNLKPGLYLARVQHDNGHFSTLKFIRF